MILFVYYKLKNKILYSILLLLFSTCAYAENMQIHGFLSQGFVYTTDNKFYGDSDNGSFEFLEAGINSTYRFNPRLRLSAQLLSRQAGVFDNGDVNIDYAFLDYRLNVAETNSWGIRAGRIKNPLGFYNETRDVAFTRPSIFLPQSIYFDSVRDLELSSDGLLLYSNWLNGNHEINIDVGVGQPRVDAATERTLLRTDHHGEFADKDLYEGRIIYSHNGGQWRLAFSNAYADLDYESELINIFTDGEMKINYQLLSLEYNGEFWQWTSEYSNLNLNYQLGPVSGLFNRKIEAWYLQSIYRFNANWSLLSRYDVLYLDKYDKSGEKYAASYQQPAYDIYAKDTTLGLKWQPNANWLLMFEFHNVDGTAWISSIDNPLPENLKRNWDMLSLSLSYRF